MGSALFNKLFPTSTGGGGGAAPTIATTVQAQTGTENTTMMTPLRATERVHQDMVGVTASETITGATQDHTLGALWCLNSTISGAATNVDVGGSYNTIATGVNGGACALGAVVSTLGGASCVALGGTLNVLNSNAASAVSGQQNTVDGFLGSVLSSQTTTITAGTYQGMALNARNCSVEHEQAIVMGRGVKTAGDYTITGGWTSTSTPSTANRSWEINQQTGNLQLEGTVSTGVTFPGFGEMFIAKQLIPKGTLVTSEDGNWVRPANPGERILGVVRGELAVNLGGGDLDNPEVEHDAFGDRVLPDGKGPRRRKREELAREQVSVAVELLGRCFVTVDSTVKPGDWLEAGKGGIGTKTAGVSVIYVDAVREGVARVRLRVGDNVGEKLAELLAGGTEPKTTNNSGAKSLRGWFS